MTLTNGSEVSDKIRIKISSQFFATVQQRIPFSALFLLSFNWQPNFDVSRQRNIVVFKDRQVLGSIDP